MKVRITVSIDKEIRKDIEIARGTIPVSTFVNEMLSRIVDKGVIVT